MFSQRTQAWWLEGQELGNGDHHDEGTYYLTFNMIIYNVLLFPIILPSEKIRVQFLCTSNCFVYMDFDRYLVGLPKYSTIGYLHLIGWMSYICMHSVGLLDKAIKTDFGS